MNKIEIKNLNVYYDQNQALSNIELSIKKNMITSLIGPSGCGKSTLIKSINRMNDLIENCKTRGKIIIDNKNILDKNVDVNKLRKKVGMVFQESNLFNKSIYDNVAFGPKAHFKMDKAELDYIVEESLKKAAVWDEVKDRLNKNALELSGGQQQRICIARALAINPNIVLMDEPTSALDPISTAKIEELILTLKEDYTIVVVTHNMQQSLRISDYTAFFLDGRLIEYEKTKSLFSNPKNKKTEDYITGRFG